MRYFILAVLVSFVCAAAPAQAEDSYAQPENEPATASGDFGGVPAGAPSYDECFRLGWVRGVHVERGEWDDFFRQCLQGRVPLHSGMAVDSVQPDRYPSH